MMERTGTRWLVRIVGAAAWPRGASSAERYTVGEVKQALRQARPDARVQRVHECAARLGPLLDQRPVRRRFRGLEDYHRRLPRILTLYCRGWEVDAIAADLSLFSTGIGVEEAINAAALVIAEQLNQQQAA